MGKNDIQTSCIIVLLFVGLLLLLSIATPVLASALPTSFDLRDINGHSYIGAVRDQGNCGGCYSFGAIAAAESSYNVANDLYDDQAVDFSEAFILWNLSSHYDDFYGCDGAGYEFEELTSLTQYGVSLERDFPYTVTQPSDNSHWDDPRTIFTDWYRIPINDIETTKRVLANIGAVDASVLADDNFIEYDGGIFNNNYTVVQAVLPYYTATNHLTALVGWNDDHDADGLGTWTLRNSWGTSWANDGYMDIGYTSAAVLLESSYLIANPWSGTNYQLSVETSPDVQKWSSGGVLNAHGVDLWGAPASSVDVNSDIIIEAVSDNEMTFARGIYLWGGAGGRVTNNQNIKVKSASQGKQAIAYAVCLQGGQVTNNGLLQADAITNADQALAFGIWVANGKNPITVTNSGKIIAQSKGGMANRAYGIWADSRDTATIINHGAINAQAQECAIGVLLSGGSARLYNDGVIEAANESYSDADRSISAGVYVSHNTIIYNSGTIKGDTGSIVSTAPHESTSNTELVLSTGSNLIGAVKLFGADDSLLLLGDGKEDESFLGVESLTMAGENWQLDGDSDFNNITITAGRLQIDGQIGGDATIARIGTLGGSGLLIGTVTNSGCVAPGNSIGKLTVNGDFIQDATGVLEIEVGDGVADLLTVTGTADLAGSLVVLPYGYATNGSYHILDAQNIFGEFESLNSSAVLHVAITPTDSNTLMLDVDRRSYFSLSSPYTRSIATTLDTIRPVAHGDLATVLNTLDLTMTAARLDASLIAMTPRIAGISTAISLDEAKQCLRQIDTHINHHYLFKSNPSSKGANNSSPTLWFSAIGKRKDFGSNGFYNKTRQSQAGFILGLDHVDDNLLVGAAMSATKSRYSVTGSAADGENETFGGYLYAGWHDSRSATGLHFDAIINSSHIAMTYERDITFMQRDATADHTAYDFAGLVSCGYTMTASDWIFDPVLSLSGGTLREEDFTEKDANGLNLSIDSQRSHFLQSQLSCRIGRQIYCQDMILQTTLYSEWSHEFNSDGETIKSQFVDTQLPFNTAGRDAAENSLLVGAEIRALSSDNCACLLRYEYCQQDNRNNVSHGVNFHIAVQF